MTVIKWLQGVFEDRKKSAESRRLYGKIDEQLAFAKSEPLTLGVECELALLDARTLKPAHKAPGLIAQLASPQIKKESFEHMIEVTSAVGANAHETEDQLKAEITRLAAACAQQGIRISGTGCPPTVRRNEMKQVLDSERYKRLQNERKILSKRFATLGLHVHVGMADAEECIRYHNFFMHFIPHLIALSASSPFEEGTDTGLMSIRPTITESLPVAGTPYNFRNWEEYVALCRAMYRAGSIERLKDLWWDIRSSPQYGTLEIRICDQPPTLAEVLALTAYIHALALWFREDQGWLDEMPRPALWRMRDNKWRAMRYGLQAELIVNNKGETRPIVEDIKLWLGRIHPHVELKGYRGYMNILEKIVARGNSAQRQRRVWNATHDLNAVTCFNCDEFEAQSPLWDQAEKAAEEKAPEKFPRAV